MFLKIYTQKLVIITLFLLAMAYLEAAVVVYLRALYYPSGFHFPLIEFPSFILYVEIGREIATMIMLWAVARLISTNCRQCFAFLMYNFGMWDIWYYIWLKILINWPSSIFDWDVLFLIPMTWIGPVLAPVITSLVLIIASFVVLKREQQNRPVILSGVEWSLEILAGLIIILSFLWDRDSIINKSIPVYYPWWLFIAGTSLGIIVFWRKVKKSNSRNT